MGGSQSKGASDLGGYITRADLLKSTEQPRLLVNRLFTYFVDRLAQKDILALANPIRCSEYVFVMTDALDRLFYELRIEPGKDKKGVILFRKASEMAKIEPESAEGQQRKVLCLSLSFFYIRIFQIYASLALSVQDDISYGSGIPLQIAPGQRTAMAAPGLEGAVFYGGATDENIGKFAILKPYITRDMTRAPGMFTFDKHANLILNTKTEKRNLILLNFGGSGFNGGPNEVNADLAITSGSKPLSRLLYIQNFKTGKTDETVRLKGHGPFSIFVTKVGDFTWEVEGTGESIDEYLFRLMSNSREVAMGRRAATKSDKAVAARAAAAAATTNGRTFNVGFPEGLRTQALLSKLKQVPKPLAHCVARSLQLLNFDALTTAKIPAEVRTSICKVKFDPAHGGLPDIGADITRSPGISALSQLFYDSIGQGKPSMSEESASSYQSFVKALAEQFAENPSAPTIHLPSVINKMEKPCGSGMPSKRDKILIVKDSNAIGVAQQAIQTLWKLQIQHDKKAIDILAKLVVVNKLGDGSVKISLNPLILQTGVPGVNIVAKEARDLLVQYYKNCETAFRIGAGPLGAAGSPI
jgi:hypothetical protein